MKIQTSIQNVLAQQQLHPVLIDIGASGAAPEVWEPIASMSVYVGFDPDEREMRDTTGDGFHRHIIVNKAVTGVPDAASVHFFLTKSPFCSSTLRPSATVLDDYLYADLFTIVRETDVPASTLEATLNDLDLPRMDWLKLDSQGIDLQILQSLSKARLDQLLAVDVEPGLLPFYEGENTFCQVHQFLLDAGFWLSDLRVLGSARMQPATPAALNAQARSQPLPDFQRQLKHTPGWVEARYLRTLDWLQTREDYSLLWTFALLDWQIGFALDLARRYREAFGEDDIGRAMQSIPLAMLAPDSTLLSRIKRRVTLPAKRLGRRLLNRIGGHH